MSLATLARMELAVVCRKYTLPGLPHVVSRSVQNGAMIDTDEGKEFGLKIPKGALKVICPLVFTCEKSVDVQKIDVEIHLEQVKYISYISSHSLVLLLMKVTEFIWR